MTMALRAPMPYSPAAIACIRTRVAAGATADAIAAELGWDLDRLRRVAARHDIGLSRVLMGGDIADAKPWAPPLLSRPATPGFPIIRQPGRTQSLSLSAPAAEWLRALSAKCDQFISTLAGEFVTTACARGLDMARIDGLATTWLRRTCVISARLPAATIAQLRALGADTGRTHIAMASLVLEYEVRRLMEVRK